MVRSGYKFSNDKAAIERLAKKYPQCMKALEGAKRDAEYARTHFADPPERLSGWGHNFCCPKCASQMIIDINMPYNPPNVFTCSNCGEKASSIDHDEAWVYYYRTRFGSYMNSCAVSALFGDTEAVDYMIRYMDFYADNYEKFPVHGKHAGKGKIMEQALDEAVWIIEVLGTLTAIDEMIPGAKKEEWGEKLLRPIVDLILPQSNFIHNIPTWLKCAVGVIAIYLGDDELLDVALNSEFGIRNQIAKGFTEDGIWYEGSMTYHFYTASAVTGFFSFYATKNPTDPIFDTFGKMFTTPLVLSYNGRTMPAINDGWYGRGAAGAHVIPGRICDDMNLKAFNDMAIAENPGCIANARALLFQLVEDDVAVFSATRLAVVKKPFHVLFKAGVISQSHMHLDALSTRISPFSDDLGTPGYGHELTKRFYRYIAAHNAIAVDQMQPAGVPVTTMEKIEDGAKATVAPGTWADLTVAERSLTVDGDKVIDLTELSAPTEHTYDWFFHSIGKAEYSTDEGEAVESLGEAKMGYDYITDIKRMKTNGSFTATFTLDNGDSLTLEIPSTEGIEVYTAKTPDNPADNKRSTVILRRTATDATFRAVFYKK